ncbi:MAG TPA: hypothetical protein VLA49_14110 [Anaerolineales bacterium]|nr:hypothetical protein [Anaerolineales bacterium]
MNSSNATRIVALLLGCLVFFGCQAENNGAAKAVESYFAALIAKDPARLTTLSCSSWETNAQTDLESFGAVTAELSDLSCSETGADDDYTVVTCTGKIVANYGDEVLELDLADQSYQARFEGGEWRMCGYR